MNWWRWFGYPPTRRSDLDRQVEGRAEGRVDAAEAVISDLERRLRQYEYELAIIQRRRRTDDADTRKRD